MKAPNINMGSEYTDPFTYVIQHLNSNPNSMTKKECVEFIKELRMEYGAGQQAQSTVVRKLVHAGELALAFFANRHQHEYRVFQPAWVQEMESALKAAKEGV